MYGGGTDVDQTVFLALSALDLHSLSADELKTLLNDDDILSQRLQGLAVVQSLRSNHDTLVASNRSLAEANLAQEPRVLQLKSDVRAQLEQVQQLEAEIREKRDKLSVVDQPLDTTLALLQTAAAEAEEESENQVQSMLADEMSLDNFLELYLPKRGVAITRRVKVDKLKELIRQGVGVVSGSVGGGSSSSAGGYQPPAPAPYLAPAPSSTPYPAAGPAPYPAAAASGGYRVPYPPASPGMPYPAPGGYPYIPGGMPMPRY